MATDNQDQALYEMSQIMQGDKESRHNFERAVSLATFGFWGLGQIHGPWKISPDRDMTCIQLFGQHYLLQNIRVAMLKEVVGLEPQRYCVVFNRTPTFYSRLKLIMNYLPQDKMFLYPAQANLGGPFLQEPWLSRSRDLCSRPSITFEEYVANFC